MSRTIGGTSAWDTAEWCGAPGTAPLPGDVDPGTGQRYGSWSAPTATTDVITQLLTPPLDAEGVSVGPFALGALRLVVEALNPTLAAGAKWDVSHWDIDNWSNGVGKWQDISSRVRGLTWDIGVSTPVDPPVVGTATLTLDNQDGALSPWFTGGAFAGADGRPWLRAGCLVRFGVVWPAANVATLAVPLSRWSPFLTGRIEDITEDTSENVDGWITITLAEVAIDLGVSAPDIATLDGRTLSQSLYAALIASGWQLQTDLVVPGEEALVCTTSLTGGTVRELLQRLADGDHWAVTVSGAGQVMVFRRHISETESGVTFSNKPSGTQMPIIKVTPFSNIERVVNSLGASRVGGTQKTAASASSINQFGTITDRYGFPRDDLVLQSDALVSALLTRVLTLYASDDLGIATIEIDTDMDRVNLPSIMSYIASAARGSVAATVQWNHPSGHVYNEHVVIETQKHDITMEGSQLKWTSTLGVHRDMSV